MHLRLGSLTVERPPWFTTAHGGLPLLSLRGGQQGWCPYYRQETKEADGKDRPKASQLVKD